MKTLVPAIVLVAFSTFARAESPAAARPSLLPIAPADWTLTIFPSPQGFFMMTGDAPTLIEAAVADSNWLAVTSCMGISPDLIKGDPVPFYIVRKWPMTRCQGANGLPAYGCYDRRQLTAFPDPENHGQFRDLTRDGVWKHEMVHLALYKATGDLDEKHETPWFDRCAGR